MATLAIWFQQTDVVFSGNAKLLVYFVGVIALAMAVQGAVMVGIAIQAAKTVKELQGTVQEMKAKVMPLIATATEISDDAKTLLRENTPKIKIIVENVTKATESLVDTSTMVKNTAQQVDRTVQDVNARAQKQAVRVDGMVSAALTATAEIAHTVHEGIRVPMNRMAVMATQAKTSIDLLISKAKSGGLFAPRRRDDF